MLQHDPSLADFNCYASYDEAVVILGDRLNVTDWNDAQETNQKRALLTASALLDQHVKWKGTVAETAQLMSWPRQSVPINDRDYGTYFDSDIVPDFLKVAVAEFANELLASDLTDDQATGLDSLRVGPIALKFKESDRKDPIPDKVKIIVEPYGKFNFISSGTVKVVRR